ncbi:MAG TPA: sensor domain-containing diguanylate cyclase [Candidatus Wunengus sp. YC60]|uniref:sensor domain-containing diguanylate cyclase n=1 Tax=Candidatus Wunengus sp. YC60 TaxID=3367697 RepID=UPI004029FA03
MTKDEVLKIVLESPSLPTLPTVACKLISISSNDEIGMKDIANLISNDASLSAKVLKVANSAFYDFPCKISTIQQAVSRLGMNAIKNLVFSFSFLSVKAKSKKAVFNYEKFWEQSLSNAVAAKLIMAEIGKSDWEEIFVAGLLQNIGELIIATSLPQQYEQVLSETFNSEKSALELERQIIGADHAFIGYEVTKKWRFPATLLTPILYHHCPEGYEGDDKKLKLAVDVIYLSGIITSILYSNNPQKYHQKFLGESKTLLDFNDEIIDKILKLVVSETTQTANVFGLHMENTKSVEEILQEANAALSDMNMEYDHMNRELEEKSKHLEKLAHLDSLTEIFNHGYFQSFLEKEINLATRKNATLSLILADVDSFKSFNDKYGHQTGDFILKELCKLMKKSLRDYDMIARYGGEEFAIVLVETTGQEAQIVAEKLRESIAMHAFIDSNKKHKVTVSFGVAEIKPAVDNFTKYELIGFADKSLFESKRKGGNSVTLYAQHKGII